jgi:hypothetical protein
MPRTPGTESALRGCLAIACLALAGCRTIEGTWGVPPFYEVYPTPSSPGVEGTEVYYRPFLGHEETDPETERVRALLPLIDFRWGPQEERFRFTPVFDYRRFVQPLGGEDLDWMVLILLLGGYDSTEGSYLALFPFGGKLRGLLGHEEIDFVLFPAYWHWRRKERHSAHVLWPLYNEVWGGDWKGWRLWPFYGRYRSHTSEGRLRYDRTFIAWPFYIRRHDQMHILPTETFFTFPFYGERLNSRTVTRTYLWPFYVYHHDRRYDRTTHAGYIFPFRFTEGQTDVWPLFGWKKMNRGTSIGGLDRRYYRHFFIWPIERYSWATDGLQETTRFWLLPLVWTFYYIDKDTLETKNYLKVWPFFTYERGGRDVAFDLISPLWLRREEYVRYYSRWFHIFRYRSTRDLSGWEVLWGAIMYRRDSTRTESLFSILGGLFECGTREGAFALRLLYLPLAG